MTPCSSAAVSAGTDAGGPCDALAIPARAFEIEARVFARARRFYARVFGLALMRCRDRPSVGARVLYVSELDACVARVERHGGRLVVPKITMGGLGWVVYCQDCEGNVLCLRERAQPARQEVPEGTRRRRAPARSGARSQAAGRPRPRRARVPV